MVNAFPEDQRARQGIWLLIGSLGIFFFASMLLYVVYIALRVANSQAASQPFYIPRGFIVSTLALLGTSLAMHIAVQAVRTDELAVFLWSLVGALVLSIVFFVIQYFAMSELVINTRRSPSIATSAHPFTLFLAFVHAVHVLGGLVVLIWVLVRAFQKKYDHERFGGVVSCAMYWHFLDIVWLVMMASFCVASLLINAQLTSF